jgi:diaminopimelate epimerase
VTFALYDVFGNRLFVAVTDAGDAELLQSSKLGCSCLVHGRRIADGVALFSPRQGFLRTAFFNPDGSFERLCGNSLLVAAAALVGLEQAATIRPFGLPPIELFRSTGYLEASSVVEPAPRAVELHGIGRVPVYDTGSPHAVLGVNNVALELDGAAAAFVRDANVNLTLVKSRGSALHARTLERGVGAETAACGTGALAVAIAAERLGEWIDVRYKTGSYRILIRRSDRGLAWTLRADPGAVELVERGVDDHDEAGPSSVSGSSSTRCST